MVKLDPSQDVQACILIAENASLAEAIRLLRESSERLAIIGDATHPKTLLSEDHLLGALMNPQDKALSQILDQLPPLIVVDGEIGRLDIRDLKELAYILQETQAPGLVVLKDEEVMGVIPREVIARALPVSALIESATRAVYGNPSTPTRRYICNKCKPPTHRRPRQAISDPLCPKDSQHGTMSEV